MANLRPSAGSVSVRNLALGTVAIDGRHTAYSNSYNKAAPSAQYIGGYLMHVDQVLYFIQFIPKYPTGLWKRDSVSVG
ncbi:hypothetical protein D0962_22405 [Leptolyngbyaceae cyanobacterium CCMR0082]|uniref:Uncharacterized protein n=1 Tax=Adonisia turfae CCMR0082 TaxID=2304604 RepID=A0A6M0SAL0_9CYAN|nr:hypothetical protein [Adonisia turfae]NEZ65490.1 hypothetical protein [Adonisia turfae CCMR0082]